MPSRLVDTWAKTYPSSSVVMKKTSAVFHSAALPPAAGSSMRATMGWTRKSRLAPMKDVVINRPVNNGCRRSELCRNNVELATRRLPPSIGSPMGRWRQPSCRRRGRSEGFSGFRSRLRVALEALGIGGEGLDEVVDVLLDRLERGVVGA